MPRLVCTACVTALLCAIDVDPAHAQCGGGYLDLQAVVAQRSVMFVGVVNDVERVGPAEIVTFVAERGWKGPVTEHMTIYRPIPALPLQPPPPPGVAFKYVDFHPTLFRQGNRYVMVAHRLSDAERHELGVDRNAVFGTDICGDSSRPLREVEPDLAPFGPGRGPVDQQTLVRGLHVAPPIKIANATPVYSIYGRVQGVVLLSITINETGSVTHAEILRSIPLYDRPAIECVLKCKYLPALFNGVPGPMVLPVSVPFIPSR